MLIDAFTFHSEKFQLLTRLHELQGVVDKFILVESCWTQSLQPKSYHFDDIKKDPEFAPFLDSIIHIKVEDKFTDSIWAQDIGQRNCIQRGLDILSPSDSDVVMISDVDECPRRELVEKYTADVPNASFLTFQMGYYCYYANLRILDQAGADFRWNGTVAVRANILKKYPPHTTIKFRDLVINQAGPNVILDGGHHVSYLGKDVTYNKYKNCVEPMDKVKGIPVKEVFDEVWKEYARPQGNFIFCDNLQNKSLGIRLANITELPQYIQNNQEKYQHLLWQEN